MKWFERLKTWWETFSHPVTTMTDSAWEKLRPWVITLVAVMAMIGFLFLLCTISLIKLAFFSSL